MIGKPIAQLKLILGILTPVLNALRKSMKAQMQNVLLTGGKILTLQKIFAAKTQWRV